jgi:hypothetical protein
MSDDERVAKEDAEASAKQHAAWLEAKTRAARARAEAREKEDAAWLEAKAGASAKEDADTRAFTIEACVVIGGICALLAWRVGQRGASIAAFAVLGIVLFFILGAIGTSTQQWISGSSEWRRERSIRDSTAGAFPWALLSVVLTTWLASR